MSLPRPACGLLYRKRAMRTGRWILEATLTLNTVPEAQVKAASRSVEATRK